MKSAPQTTIGLVAAALLLTAAGHAQISPRWTLIRNAEMTVTADSYRTFYFVDYLPSLAIDNSTASGWGTAAALPNWLQLDLGARRNVAGLQLFASTYRINGYSIFVTDNPDDWGDPVASGNLPNTSDWHPVTVPFARGRHLFIRADSRHAGYSYIYEVRVYEALAVADRLTGSRRLTNTNRVDVVAFFAPEGYDRYELTTQAAPTGVWTPTNEPPTTAAFDFPASDGIVTWTAWYTNATDAVPLTNLTTEIYYTTAPPPPPEITPVLDIVIPVAGTAARVRPEDLDVGPATGGLINGETASVYRLVATLVSGPAGGDATPDAPYVTLPHAGIHEISMTVINEAGNQTTSLSNCLVTVTVAEVPPPTADLHVVDHNPAAQSPYATWATAAATIQDAVDAAMAGQTILVWPGVYETGGRPFPGRISTNRVMIDKAVTVQAVAADPRATVIRGAPDRASFDGYGRGPGAVRGARLVNQARLTGFTITRGHTRLDGDATHDQRGGGLLLDGGAVVAHCIISNNTAMQGGGAYFIATGTGSIDDSIIAGNTAWDNGGGVVWGHLNRCIVSNNLAGSKHGSGTGGGVVGTADSIFNRCVIAANTSFGHGGGGGGSGGSYFDCDILDNRHNWEGGGLNGPVLARGCLIQGNAGRYGSGGFGGRYDRCRILANNNMQNTGGAVCGGWAGGFVYLTNCLVAYNFGGAGTGSAGVNQGIVWNSTIVSNHNLGVQANAGYYSALTNCIVYANESRGNFRADRTYHIGYSCTTTNTGIFPDAVAIITNTPRFVAPESGDFRLAVDSPCRDAGWHEPWMDAAFDLDGRRRVIHAAPDIGAYEYRAVFGTVLSFW